MGRFVLSPSIYNILSTLNLSHFSSFFKLLHHIWKEFTRSIAHKSFLDNRKKHEYKKEKEIKIVQGCKSFEIFDEVNFFLV